MNCDLFNLPLKAFCFHVPLQMDVGIVEQISAALMKRSGLSAETRSSIEKVKGKSQFCTGFKDQEIQAICSHCMNNETVVSFHSQLSVANV